MAMRLLTTWRLQPVERLTTCVGARDWLLADAWGVRRHPADQLAGQGDDLASRDEKTNPESTYLVKKNSFLLSCALSANQSGTSANRLCVTLPLLSY